MLVRRTYGDLAEVDMPYAVAIRAVASGMVEPVGAPAFALHRHDVIARTEIAAATAATAADEPKLSKRRK